MNRHVTLTSTAWLISKAIPKSELQLESDLEEDEPRSLTPARCHKKNHKIDKLHWFKYIEELTRAPWITFHQPATPANLSVRYDTVGKKNKRKHIQCTPTTSSCERRGWRSEKAIVYLQQEFHSRIGWSWQLFPSLIEPSLMNECYSVTCKTWMPCYSLEPRHRSTFRRN
jgi:hypothetical protein